MAEGQRQCKYHIQDSFSGQCEQYDANRHTASYALMGKCLYHGTCLCQSLCRSGAIGIAFRHRFTPASALITVIIMCWIFNTTLGTRFGLQRVLFICVSEPYMREQQALNHEDQLQRGDERL